MSGQGRSPAWGEVLGVHPTPRWGAPCPLSTLALSSATPPGPPCPGAQMAPSLPRPPARQGVLSAGLAGKSGPGAEHGAQPCTKPSWRAVPALPTSCPGGRGGAPFPRRPSGMGGVRLPPGRPQGLHDRTHAAAPPGYSGQDAAPWVQCHLRGHPEWQSPPGSAGSPRPQPPRRAPNSSRPTPRVLPVTFVPHPYLTAPRPREPARAARRRAARALVMGHENRGGPSMTSAPGQGPTKVGRGGKCDGAAKRERRLLPAAV